MSSEPKPSTPSEVPADEKLTSEQKSELMKEVARLLATNKPMPEPKTDEERGLAQMD